MKKNHSKAKSKTRKPGRLRGRPRSRLVDGIVFPSMESCEGATGIPKELQQSAKRDGSSAFDAYGRVHLGELLRWIFGKGLASDAIDWSLLNTELDAKLKQVKLDKEVRTVITLQEAQKCITALMGICTNAIKRMAIEFPKTLEHRSATEIKAACDATYRDVLKRMEAEIQAMK